LDQTDPQVFQKVFVAKEYDFNLPEDARNIVDAGANVGYSAVWFALRYPKARIIAIEPDEENFAILRETCAAFENITCVLGAVWSQDTKLELRRNSKSWGSRTIEGQGATVPAYSLNTIMRDHALDKIDILKIDIEGAEKEVFSAPDRQWLDKVTCMAIETHDRFRPGSQAAVRDATAAAFVGSRKGENEFFHRKLPITSAAPTREQAPFEHVWLVSDGRSGSTWVESLIGNAGRFASYFEPMHAGLTPALKGEPLVRYLRPGHVPDQYAELYRAVLSRHFSNPRAGPFRAENQAVLIKDIHALLSARAISALFPSMKVVCLVRHPVDVAKSKMRLSNWMWLKEPSVLLDQTQLREDWLEPFSDLMNAASSQFEKYVAIWCAMYFVFDRQFEGAQVEYVSYKAIGENPQGALSRVLAGVAGKPRALPPRLMKRRSWTARPETGVAYSPSDKELSYAEQCVTAFKLSHLI
jgi:FkbM family methyltransferase